MNDQRDLKTEQYRALQDLLAHRDFVPYAVLVLGVLFAFVVLFLFKPEAVPEEPAQSLVPIVDWVEVQPERRSITVQSQGTVQPRIAIDLVAQVAGRVQQVNENFAEGGFFAAGEQLVSIEPLDYQYALVRAQSRVAEAEKTLATEKGRAKQAKREWRDLGDKESNDLFLRKPQLASAEAALKAAIADRDKAKLDLERTTINAPFEGRIWEKRVDVGQYVTPGTPIAKIYATDKVEVRLPLTNRQVGLVDLPLALQNGTVTEQPDVMFTAEFGRMQHQWQGKVVRTEASIDTESRVVFAVAEVEHPFVEPDGSVATSPMAIGLFVEGKIEGHAFDNVMTLPRDALLQNNQIYTVAEGHILVPVDVEVLQANAEQATVQAAIPPGTIVVTSHVPFAAPGLKVKLRARESAALAGAE